jgi:hypothetical protein
VGTHSITAVYGGDANVTGSTSSGLTQTVNQTVVTILPTPTILLSGGNVVINWPTNATSFTLMSNGNITSPITSWGVAGSGLVVGTNYQVTLPAGATANFFRLVK